MDHRHLGQTFRYKGWDNGVYVASGDRLASQSDRTLFAHRVSARPYEKIKLGWLMNYHNLGGNTVVTNLTEKLVLDQPGCGGTGNDFANCQVNDLGQVTAVYHAACSAPNDYAVGAWVGAGSYSRTSQGAWWLHCVHNGTQIQ